MFKRIEISNSTVLLLVVCLVFVCSILVACKKGDSTQNTSGPTIVKAKVDIPKGLKFTNEMLDLVAPKDGEKTDSTYSKKEELLERRAAKDIAAGKVIHKEDTADKDATFEESETADSSGNKTEEKPEEDTKNQESKEESAEEKPAEKQVK